MEEELQKLKSVCFELARSTIWEQKPIDVDIITNHADRLYEIAIEQANTREILGATIPIVTRAVDYLRQAHAIPPLKEDLTWFQEMLNAVLEIACPNSEITGEGRQFLYDLLESIKEVVHN
jgi:hypothetical protein